MKFATLNELLAGKDAQIVVNEGLLFIDGNFIVETMGYSPRSESKMAWSKAAVASVPFESKTYSLVPIAPAMERVARACFYGPYTAESRGLYDELCGAINFAIGKYGIDLPKYQAGVVPFPSV